MANSPSKKETGTTVSDLYKTDKATWEYVTIPEENALGEKHPEIRLNQEVFEPGKTYLVPKQVADYVRERLRVYVKSCVRILSPKRDFDALKAVPVGSAGGNVTQVASDSALASNFQHE